MQRMNAGFLRVPSCLALIFSPMLHNVRTDAPKHTMSLPSSACESPLAGPQAQARRRHLSAGDFSRCQELCLPVYGNRLDSKCKLRASGWLRRQRLGPVLALVLLLALAASQYRQLARHSQNLLRGAYYGLDPALFGRAEDRFPAPTCCRDHACLQPHGTGRVAVVTYLRNPDYVPLVQQLECTLRRTNPGLELALMTVEGELPDESLDLLRSLNITLLPVQPVPDYVNKFEAKYGRNWLKIRAWGLVQYDAVLLLDSDTAVAGPISHVLQLPTHFAGVWDQRRWLSRFKTLLRPLNGGMLMLRPCRAIEAHMLSLLEQHPKLRFTYGTAEQDFLSWYFRYTGMTLPLHYNCQVTQSLVGDTTVGGVPPLILHFTRDKPFNGPQPGVPGHQFLCSSELVAARALTTAAQPSTAAAAASSAAGPAALPGSARAGSDVGEEKGASVVEQLPEVTAGGGAMPALLYLEHGLQEQQLQRQQQQQPASTAEP